MLITGTEFFGEDAVSIKRSLVETGKWHGEVTKVRKDGSRFHVSMETYVVYDSNEKITGYVILTRDITEKRQAEQKTQEVYHTLELAMELAKMAWWEMNVATGNVTFHKRKAEILGYEPEKFKHYTDFMALVHPDDKEKLMSSMRNHINGISDKYEGEYRILNKKGTYQYFYDIGAANKRDKEGTVISITGIVLDITNRKSAEEHLAYQSLVLENINDAVVASDDHFRITHWNKAAELTYGWKAEEVLGKIGLQIFQTEFPGVDAQLMRQIIEEKGSWIGEATQMRKDGSRFPVEVSSIAIRDNEGKMTGYISVNRDITERKKITVGLEESEERFKLANLATFSIIWDYNFQTDSLWWNDNFMKQFGFHFNDIGTGIKSWTKRIHPDDLNRIEAGLHKALDSKLDKWTDQYRFQRKDGTYAMVEDRAYIVRNQHGMPLRMVGAIRDITQHIHDMEIIKGNEKRFRDLIELLPQLFWTCMRDIEGNIIKWLGSNTDFNAIKKATEKLGNFNKELEKNVNDRTALLEAAIKELDAFSYSVSHDLQAPLRAINGFTNILVEDYVERLDSEAKRLFSIISYNTLKMGKLIDDLLSFSRIGRLNINPALIDMRSLAIRVFNENTDNVLRKKINFSIYFVYPV